ncbi:MAG: peptidoglycan DD-metalloendopeptidase family protein [Candidatus Liptonbacteria bacterium]
MKHRYFATLVVLGVLAGGIIYKGNLLRLVGNIVYADDDTLAATASSSVTASIAATDAAKAELEQRIQTKSQQLDLLNRDLAAKQEELHTAVTARVSLQQEVSTLEKNISRLKLSIQADQVSSEKLGLEIDSLNYNIKDAELAIQNKTESINNLISELYVRDNDSPFLTFLKNKSIGDTLSEVEAIRKMKVQLRDEVDNLSKLKITMENQRQDVSDKKQQIETQKRDQLAKKAIIEDQQQTKKVVLSETKSKESVYQQQIADLSAQQDALSNEIQQIEDELRAKFNPDLLPTKGNIFSWPVVLTDNGGSGRISQHYGVKSALYRGNVHNGLDIATPVGTPVYAAADGIVSAVDVNDQSAWRKYQYGKYILIKHGNNLSTLYGHLSKQLVSAGNTVKRGQLIGYSGNTGYSTGAHLHFGVYWAANIQLKSIPPAAGLVPVGVTVNPEDYL